MTFKERLDKAFRRYGEGLMINGIIPAKGFFQRLDTAGLKVYFDYEQTPAPRSGLIVFMPADTSVGIGDTIDRDPRIYTVSKISKHLVRDTVVMQILLLQ